MQSDEIKAAISKAREIANIHKLHYLNSDASEKSLDNLIDICRCYLGKNISLYEHTMPYTAQPIRGFYLAFNDGHYEIAILAEQKRCWRRLVTCKELFHIILDEEKYESNNIADLVDEATLAIPSSTLLPNAPVRVEVLAQMTAMEYLFPYVDRKIILSQFEHTQDDVDYGRIAEQFKIPRIFVERYLKKQYMDILNC